MYTCDLWLKPSSPVCVPQGIVIGTGENSEFGEVFKMMQAEEVSYPAFELNINKQA